MSAARSFLLSLEDCLLFCRHLHGDTSSGILAQKNMSDLPEVNLTLEHKAHPDITGPNFGLLFKVLNTYQAAIFEYGHKISFWPQVKDPPIRYGLHAQPLLHSQKHMSLGLESP